MKGGGPWEVSLWTTISTPQNKAFLPIWAPKSFITQIAKNALSSPALPNLPYNCIDYPLPKMFDLFFVGMTKCSVEEAVPSDTAGDILSSKFKIISVNHFHGHLHPVALEIS